MKGSARKLTELAKKLNLQMALEIDAVRAPLLQEGNNSFYPVDIAIKLFRGNLDFSKIKKFKRLL